MELGPAKPDQSTILVVDDEEDILDLLDWRLTSEGFVVKQASNVEHAHAILKANDIDLILSDMRMPGQDGLDLLNFVKNRNLEKPVMLILTGQTNIAVEDIFHKGAEGIVYKPMELDVLVATIREYLIKRSHQWLEISAKPDISLKSPQPLNQEVSKFSCLNTGCADDLNLSFGRGGMFVPVPLPTILPTLNKEFSFEINLGAQRLYGKGLARWVRETPVNDTKIRGFGLEFSALTPNSREMVLQRLKANKTLAFIPAY